MENNNLNLWNKVEKTNPKYTKKAKVSGMNITAISPQFQVMNATEQFGSYGEKWGFKKIELDYSITNTPITLSVQDWNTKVVSEMKSILGLVGFKATFFFPNGEFEITNSIKIFTDNKHSKIDDNYAKKLETDALTKALSKLGFNADIFLGKFDDVRYLDEVKKDFAEKEQKVKEVKKPDIKQTQYDAVLLSKNKDHATYFLSNTILTEEQRKGLEDIKKGFDLDISANGFPNKGEKHCDATESDIY